MKPSVINAGGLLNRPVATGMTLYNGTRQQLQAYLDDASYSFTPGNYTYQTTTTGGGGGVADLEINTREIGRTLYQASNSIIFIPEFESELNADFVAEIVTTGGTTITTSSTIYIAGNPIPGGATFTALTLSFYDNYNNTQKVFDKSNNSKLDGGTNSFPEALPSAPSQLTKGMVTSGKVWVLENANNLSTGKWLESVTFYYDKGRPIQGQKNKKAVYL